MTAEQTIKKFFEYLKKATQLDEEYSNTFKKDEKIKKECIENIENAAKLCTKTYKETRDKGFVISSVGNICLATMPTTKINVKKISEISDCCHDYKIELDKGIFTIRVICEVAQYQPNIKGVWGVNPLSIKKL